MATDTDDRFEWVKHTVDLHFAQGAAAGFTEHRLPEELDYMESDGNLEARADWLFRNGYTTIRWRVGDEGAVAACAFAREEATHALPKFLVVFEDRDTTENIFVSDEASLFVLRTQLTQLCANVRAIEAADTAARAFDHACHGHKANEVCVDCEDPAVEYADVDEDDEDDE